MSWAKTKLAWLLPYATRLANFISIFNLCKARIMTKLIMIMMMISQWECQTETERKRVCRQESKQRERVRERNKVNGNNAAEGSHKTDQCTAEKQLKMPLPLSPSLYLSVSLWHKVTAPLGQRQKQQDDDRILRLASSSLRQVAWPEPAKLRP